MDKEGTIRNTVTNASSARDSIKYVITVCSVFAALILGRAVNNVFLYAILAVGLVIFLLSSISHSFCFLFFLLPFASVLKTNVDGISFYTIFFFVVVLKMILMQKSLSTNMIMSLMLFALYNILFSGFEQITTTITMVFGLAMLYCLRTTKIDVNLTIVSFCFGIVISSILALFKNSFPIINGFVSDSMLRLEGDDYAIRFSGLQGNPNYYTLDILIVLAAIIVLMYNKSALKIYTVCLITLSVFGLMSVSKSFLLCWILLVVFWLVLSIKKGFSKFVKFMIIGIICCAAVYFYAFDSINTYIFRFAKDSGATWGEMTTGRIGIWKQYVEMIFNDTKLLFLGRGLNSSIEGLKGTHNTYLEAIFYLGVIGTILFIIALKSCMGKVVSKPIMCIPIIMLLIRMLSIGILTYDNIWFYLAILACVSRHIGTNNIEVQNEENKKNPGLNTL